MKKCPYCSSLNKPADKFCSNCGKNLYTPVKKSKSFRNFIIIISVFFSIVIIGLVVYYILVNYTNNYLSTLLSKQNQQLAQTSDSTDIDNQQQSFTSDTNSSIVLTKEKLSADQKRVISLFGYPDQFTIIFDESYDNKRIDAWIYYEMEALFMFENGTYNDSDHYFGPEHQSSEYKIFPQDFVYGMTPLEVKTLIGQEGTFSFEELTGLNILTFGQGEVICIFNPDDRLIIVSKQDKLSDDT